MEKAHTQKNTLLKTAASQRCKPKFLREYFFLQPREEFYFFSPTLRCFNFFANAQPTTDIQSDSLLQTLTGQCNLTQTTEARTAKTLSRIYKSPPQISQIKSQRLVRLLNIRCSARPDEGLYFS